MLLCSCIQLTEIQDVSQAVNLSPAGAGSEGSPAASQPSPVRERPGWRPCPAQIPGYKLPSKRGSLMPASAWMTFPGAAGDKSMCIIAVTEVCGVTGIENARRQLQPASLPVSAQLACIVSSEAGQHSRRQGGWSPSPALSVAQNWHPSIGTRRRTHLLAAGHSVPRTFPPQQHRTKGRRPYLSRTAWENVRASPTDPVFHVVDEQQRERWSGIPEEGRSLPPGGRRGTAVVAIRRSATAVANLTPGRSLTKRVLVKFCKG